MYRTNKNKYICNVVVISNCTIENKPIICEYLKKENENRNYITYVETLSTELENIVVEIKQIQTNLAMFDFLKVNIEKADFIVIYTNTNYKPIDRQILELLQNKQTLKINNESDIANSVDNKITELLNNDLLKLYQMANAILSDTTDNTMSTIFGRTSNARLIAIDNWLDRWLFCCFDK